MPLGKKNINYNTSLGLFCHWEFSFSHPSCFEVPNSSFFVSSPPELPDALLVPYRSISLPAALVLASGQIEKCPDNSDSGEGLMYLRGLLLSRTLILPFLIALTALQCTQMVSSSFPVCPQAGVLVCCKLLHNKWKQKCQGTFDK